LFIGWDALMAKCFQPMPVGFTSNFLSSLIKVSVLFDIWQTRPDSEAWSVNFCPNLDECRKGVLIELFGTTCIAAMVFDNLKLLRHQGTIC